MSTRARYGFAIVLVLYGIYQLNNDGLVLGLLGFALAGAFLWLVPKR